MLEQKTNQLIVNKVDFETIIKPNLENITIITAPNYNSLRNILKDKFIKALEKITNPINSIGVGQFTIYAPADAASKLTETCFDVLKIDYKDISAAIIPNKGAVTKAIAQYLTQVMTEINKEDSAKKGMDTPTVVIPPTSTSQTQPFNPLSVILMIVLAVAIAALFFYFRNEHTKIYQKLRLFEELQKNREYGAGRRPDDRSLTSGNDLYKPMYSMSDIEKIIVNSNFLQTLSTEVNDIKRSLEQNKSNNNYYDNPVQTTETMEKAIDKDIFYMSGPVNNYFPNSGKIDL